MGDASPKPRPESSREYQRLLRGEGTSKEYVATLKREARARVEQQRRAVRRRSASS